MFIDQVTGLLKKQLLTEMEYREYREKYDHLSCGRGFKGRNGAEAIKAAAGD